jgi:NADPH-dependent 2,4-dienoyl-CoA reductase/sulfur reductase-like enzyme
VKVDVVVVGGGPAGLASALSAYEEGAEVVVIDRNHWLGGILQQCIHDGFGIEEFGESMTGPEYAHRYIKEVEKTDIRIMTETTVLEFDRKITAVNKEGVHKIEAGSIILAMGCREKTRWNALIPGSRPSGIYTAGVAQAFINLYNLMPGENVVILGSGDVGLIMARRFKLEGANVLGVVEILPYAGGLPRNVVQCLEDYGIPLFLSHTITNIEGRERLESVTIAKVDKKMNPIPGTERKMECDTLLLSLGLIPENELSRKVGIEIDPLTGGPVVNQSFQTSLPRVFACGNCLQVYDTVDMLSIDAREAGKNAASKRNRQNRALRVIGKGLKHVVPQRIDEPGKVSLTFRVKKPGPANIIIKFKNRVLLEKKMRWLTPANMVRVEVEVEEKMIPGELEVISE